MSNVILTHAARTIQDSLIVARHLARKAGEGLQLILASFVGVAQLQKLRRSPKLALGAAGLVGVIVALAVALCLEEDGASFESCPAAKPQSRPSPGSPSDLMARLKGGAIQDERKHALLRQCVDWAPPGGAVPPMEQVRAQLECHAELTTALPGAAEAEALLARSWDALGAVRGTTQRCEDLSVRLSSLNREKTAMKKPSEVLVALGGLAGFEGVARETAAALTVLKGISERFPATDSQGDTLGEISDVRSRFSTCTLRAAREARLLAHSLPVHDPRVARVQRCKSEMLKGFEQMALQSAEQAADSQNLLAAGLLLSERSTAPATAPFFGEAAGKTPDSSLDEYGATVSADMVAAEKLLFRGLQAAPAEEQKDRSKQVLMRLAKHAKLLAEDKEYEGAEGRYRKAAEVAKNYEHNQLAASTLAQLSYFLSLHSRYQEALDAATEALSFSHDALATYLQATLRLGLGELRTDSQVQEALESLRAIAGKMPAEHLEANRASTVEKLESWQDVSDAGTFIACFKFSDAALLLSCFLSRFSYN
eukprot:TRINITY_DN122206_c0_g1_i1.p1 TRINITY_DN122206_c0_g1~~TRINITY_DN122206_c0_g1_i1.p1  ORF type:complete len:539 (-),score=125.67 TRINITY_DN122206_c0_g1_i1:30-1646(-)